MPCFNPLQAVPTGMTAKGKVKYTFVGSVRNKVPLVKRIFNKFRSFVFLKKVVTLPCGRCHGCRLERSRQWAIRIVHERDMHEQNSFITLTFSPEALSKRDFPQSLDVRDFQLFMKRFRKRFTGTPIRFYHCGEYGDLKGRPHYHAIIFGFDFPDKVLYKENHRGDKLYTSAILSELWPFGFATIGDVTFESAAYCARYVMKKINGDKAEKHYRRVDSETGEVLYLKPEYTTMSRRSGIGKTWLDRYLSDVYPSDSVVMRGIKMKPPRYYDSLYEHIDASTLDELKRKRKALALKHASDNTPARLAVRELVAKLRLDRLIRSHDTE